MPDGQPLDPAAADSGFRLFEVELEPDAVAARSSLHGK